MKNELFGPIVTIYLYNDKDFEKTLKLIDKTSDYALTGSIFSRKTEILLHKHQIF